MQEADGEQLPIFRGLKRPRGEIENATEEPRTVEVMGSHATWLNQTYKLSHVSKLEKIACSSFPAWRAANKGEWVWLGEHPSPKGVGSVPFIWYDRRNRQWKLATIGFQSSHYISNICENFPEDVGTWRPGPQSKEADPDFLEEMRQAAHSIRVFSVEKGAARRLSPKVLERKQEPYPVLLEDVQLNSADASTFVKAGYIVINAERLGTRDLAAEALRASNMIIRDAVLTGRNMNLQDCVRSPNDWDWATFTNLLRGSPVLWTLIARMLNQEAEVPKRCQVAISFPTGSPCDKYKDIEDRQSGTDYHIDGRGKIPNGFTLLVGVSLTDQSMKSQSWGGLTVFCGSHTNSNLHRAYPQQKSASANSRFNLGSGSQIRLQQGDVVVAHSLLAHRRAENWAEDIRHMVYFRLKPAQRSATWESGLLDDPFANLRGVWNEAAGHCASTVDVPEFK